MKKHLRIIKLCLAALLAAGLGMAVWTAWERQEGVKSYEEAAAVAQLVRDVQGYAPREEEALTEEEKEAETLLGVDLAALREVNPDVIGWIEIPGTKLSYPLMQGEDNSYYLNHTWNNAKNSAGSIYMDCNSSSSLDGFHTIIYGHRMRNETMFGMLKYYKDQDFWQEHPSIYLLTEDGVTRYDVFSARQASVKGLVFRLDLEEGRLEEAFIRDCVDNSLIDTGIVPDASSRILTLSTCTGNGYAARWVVQAVERGA